MNEAKRNTLIGLAIGFAIVILGVFFALMSKTTEFIPASFIALIIIAIALIPIWYFVGLRKEEMLVKEWKRKNPGKDMLIRNQVLFLEGEDYSEKQYGIAIFTKEQFSFVKEKQPEKVFYYNEMSEKRFGNINLSGLELGGSSQVLPLISFNYAGKKYAFSLGRYKLKTHQKIAKELFGISSSENYSD